MAHDLNSIMILIHPPLSILGYLITLIALKSALQLTMGKGDDEKFEERRKDLRISLVAAWIFTFLGLITGMIWAQLAWGRFWGWDPKETGTLFVFLTLSLALVMNLRRIDVRGQLAVLVLNVVLILYTLSITFFDWGLHSF